MLLTQPAYLPARFMPALVPGLLIAFPAKALFSILPCRITLLALLQPSLRLGRHAALASPRFGVVSLGYFIRLVWAVLRLKRVLLHWMCTSALRLLPQQVLLKCITVQTLHRNFAVP